MRISKQPASPAANVVGRVRAEPARRIAENLVGMPVEDCGELGGIAQ
jgi:hypothetical protein